MKGSIFLLAVPSALPLVHGLRGLGSSVPAQFSGIIQNGFPLGNGRLGAMPWGSAGTEKFVMNIDSLWSGGPFAVSSYTGGNPASSIASKMATIRANIFKSGTGSMSGILGSNLNYGSYQVYGNLTVTIGGVSSGSKYRRQLDFDTGLHTTTYTGNDGNDYTTTSYCSYPDQVCIVNVASSGTLPSISVGIDNGVSAGNLITSSCESGYVRMVGYTLAGIGMKYDGMARIVGMNASCTNNKLVVPAGAASKSVSVVFGANTNYDWKFGNAANSFSFKGADPGAYVQAVTIAAATKSESVMRAAHMADYQALSGQFKLTLPDTAGTANNDIATNLKNYASGNGDPHTESTLFDLGRHMFISSSRANSLPPNAAGRWNAQLAPSWGDDYHANINEQMALWGAEQTGLGDLMVATFNYMQYTWVPRGTETAQLLYGAQGWVTHDEMNIFGHTAMKSSAQWANYPASAAWMMQHVFDRYHYGQNATWFLAQGYPLMKGVAQFWLSGLQQDTYTKDGTLVVNPCNSPEHGPTTFGCMHYQQLIYQLFSNIVGVSAILPSTESAFLAQVTTALKTLHKGFEVGSFGEVKEWKLPDSLGYDFKNDTHRHLSNLIGWYPGYSLSGLMGGYRDKTIQNAVTTTLWSRGPGNIDANAGWEKTWRGACWAQLNNTERAYFELKLAVGTNYASNGFSMYSGTKTPFQIDANFGMMGNILSMLISDWPAADGQEGRTAVLGPAIPTTWAGGQVTGMRLRGGGSVAYSWDKNGLVTNATMTGRTLPITLVNKGGTVLAKV